MKGLCQILFFESDEIGEASYADRKGKCRAQKGIAFPRL
jgi:dCTP deaminase